jgi:hypothetical protein
MKLRIFSSLIVIVVFGYVWLELKKAGPDPESNKRSEEKWVQRIGGTNSLALTLITTGDEPDVFHFFAPLTMQVTAASGEYKSTNEYCQLMINDNGQRTWVYYFQTNGGYQIEYIVPFSPRGSTHFLKLELATSFREIYGPPITIRGTNIFKFDDSNIYGNKLRYHCRLGIQHAGYKIEISDTSNVILKTFSNETTNGIVSETWDLKTADGQVRTNDEFNIKFQVWRIYAGTNDDVDNGIYVTTNPVTGNYLRDKSNAIRP